MATSTFLITYTKAKKEKFTFPTPISGLFAATVNADSASEAVKLLEIYHMLTAYLEIKSVSVIQEIVTVR